MLVVYCIVLRAVFRYQIKQAHGAIIGDKFGKSTYNQDAYFYVLSDIQMAVKSAGFEFSLRPRGEGARALPARRVYVNIIK